MKQVERLKAWWKNPAYRTMFWAVLIGLFFTVLDPGAPVDHALRVARNSLRAKPVSGDIVLASINRPMDRFDYARLIDHAFDAGASRVFLLPDLDAPSDAVQDAALEKAINRHKGAVALASYRDGAAPGHGSYRRPLERFAHNASLADTSVIIGPFGFVETQAYSKDNGGIVIPTLSAALAKASDIQQSSFDIDYAFQLRSLKQINADDVLATSHHLNLTGKTVVFDYSPNEYTRVIIPGQGSGARTIFAHLLAAETLKATNPVNLGGWIALAIGLAGSIVLLRLRRIAYVLFVGAGFFAFAFAFAILTESFGYFQLISPVLAILLFVAGSRIRRLHKLKDQNVGATHQLSGLRNLGALRASTELMPSDLIVAKVHNYSDINGHLSPEIEQQILEQIKRRLSFSTADSELFQGDEGGFAWVRNADDPEIGDNELDALFQLFRTPVVTEVGPVDLIVTFGVAGERSLPLSNRLGQAIKAAEEAFRDGKRWCRVAADSAREQHWRLSLLGALDAAIDNGEVWVAYQPQLRLANHSIAAVEALVRWTHPEKGAISPADFVELAEKHNRIEKLTYFVLNRAISEIGGSVPDISVAVNISARMLERSDFVGSVNQILSRANFAAERLTLELTETATLADRQDSADILLKLAAMGIRISIDDYGTGFSTLEYFKSIPAEEIKIDRSFVAMIEDNRSDRIMVNSTVQMAHALDREIVAEGVESPQQLSLLRDMGCDIVQGYFISKPMVLKDLISFLQDKKWIGARAA